MRLLICVGVFALSLGLMAGCDKKKDDTKTTDAANKMKDAGADMKDAAKDMKDKAVDTGAAMKDKAADTGAAMKDKAGDMANTAKDKTAAGMGAMADAASESQAKILYDQITGYVKDNKLDLADKSLTELQAIKPKLSADWQAKIDALADTVSKAKAAMGGNAIPKLPGQ